MNPELLKELHRINHHHYSRLVAFVVFYTIAACTAFWLALQENIWCYIVCLPLYLLAAASLHGISLFTHEGVHGVLHRNPHWNRILSILCALPVLQNFSAYKVLHLKHHKHLGLEGDPDHYSNYTKWTWLVFLMHWGRLLIGYPVYITAIPILGFRQGNAVERIWISIEVVLLLLLIAGVLLSPIPQELLIHGWLIPMLFINTMVNSHYATHEKLDTEHATDLLRLASLGWDEPRTRAFVAQGLVLGAHYFWSLYHDLLPSF